MEGASPVFRGCKRGCNRWIVSKWWLRWIHVRADISRIWTAAGVSIRKFIVIWKNQPASSGACPVPPLMFLMAGIVYPLTTPVMINDFKACGGLLLLATGFRMIKVKMFPTADMIPAMILAMPCPIHGFNPSGIDRVWGIFICYQIFVFFGWNTNCLFKNGNKIIMIRVSKGIPHANLENFI